MEYPMNSAKTTSPPKGNCIEERTPIYWNSLEVQSIVIPLVSCFSFAQVMVFWESISKWGASTSEIVTASAVSWKHLSTFSKSILKQLVKVLLSVDLWYRSTGFYVSWISFHTWKYSCTVRYHLKSELIVCVGTATFPVSWRQMV